MSLSWRENAVKGYLRLKNEVFNEIGGVGYPLCQSRPAAYGSGVIDSKGFKENGIQNECANWGRG